MPSFMLGFFSFWLVVVKGHHQNTQILKMLAFALFVPRLIMRYVDVTLSSLVYLLASLLRCFIIRCFAYIMHLFRQMDLYRV